jgi:hypothetical protein
MLRYLKTFISLRHSVRYYSDVSNEFGLSVGDLTVCSSNNDSNFELNRRFVNFDVSESRVMGVLNGFVNADSSIERLNEIYLELTSFNKEGFIKSSDPMDLPVLGEVYKEMGFNNLKLSESSKRIVIEGLYDMLLLHLIDCIRVKLRGLEGDPVHDLRVLLKTLLFKLNPGVRRLLLGISIGSFDRFYVGYDTEFQAVEYGENKLISYQLAVAVRCLIKVNNIPSLYEFERVVASTGEVYELDGLKDDARMKELLDTINIYLLRNKPIDKMKVNLLNILFSLKESGEFIMARDGDSLIFTRNVMGADKFADRVTYFEDMRVTYSFVT